MKSNEQYANWTDEMYQCLSWCLFKKVYGATEWHEREAERIKQFLKKSATGLTTDQHKIVENRALRLGNEYHKWSLENFEKMYGDDLFDDDRDYGEDDFRRAPIDYNNDYYLVWTDAARKRQTVKMKYDSTTSGISDRLVDPYKTRSPYGEGFCHTRGEVRKFRFDRIIDIVMTSKKFIKPKNWDRAINKN